MIKATTTSTKPPENTKNGFTGAELRKFLGYSSTSFPADRVRRAIKANQTTFTVGDKTWRWEGDGQLRRYFQC